MTDQTPAIAEIRPDIRRVTVLQGPAPGHVHCYLLRGQGGWTLVDTGLGVPGAGAFWRRVVDGLDGPLERVAITHMHVDHIGAAADVAPLSRGPVLQGRLDREQARTVYGDRGWGRTLADHLRRHGMPPDEAAAVEGSWRGFASLARPAPAEPLDPGDRVDGWEVVPLPGHADGHIGLLRDAVLVAGDALLPDITPTIGLWPGGDPDPLGHYLATLDRIVALAPELVLPGHGDPIDDPAGRARETADHHRDRLDRAAGALGPHPATATAYEVSQELWPNGLAPGQRSFAVAEALAHLERLVRAGRARATRDAPDGRTAFSAPAGPPAARAAAPSR